MSEEEKRLSRRELLKKAGAGAVAVGAAGAGAPFAFAGPHKYRGRWLSGNLTAITWVHFVPSYDAWLDPWAKAWGEANDVQVTIDHINNTLLDTRAAAEVAAQSGHDLFFNLHPMASYYNQVIDHKDIITEVEKTQGKYMPIAQASTYAAKLKKYFAVSDSYVPDPVVWRYDLWTGVGAEPNTWENVLKAAPKLKKIGHPIGIGQSQELDSSMALYAFMMCFGSFLQDENNRPSLDTKKTVQAVNFMAQLYRVGETPDIFSWNPASNNNYLYAGTASLILNAISATRTP
ncbi:MAG: twin-arginine translocation signal domain-containing protein, partial [Thermoplasmata archaeon]